MKLLNILQSSDLKTLHSAQVDIVQCAGLTFAPGRFSFSGHPRHFSLRYFPHAPQYNPQNATNLGSDTFLPWESPLAIIGIGAGSKILNGA
jgi:hypothetical protein